MYQMDRAQQATNAYNETTTGTTYVMFASGVGTRVRARSSPHRRWEENHVASLARWLLGEKTTAVPHAGRPSHVITSSTAGPAGMFRSDRLHYCPMDPAPPRSGRLPSSRAPTPRASPHACRSEIQVPQTARASLAGPQPH